MDFSNFNAGEQAHMTKIIEKRQVCRPISNGLLRNRFEISKDARLPPNVCESRRKML